MTTASDTSEVITGRRMKISARFIWGPRSISARLLEPSQRSSDLDPGARSKQHLPVGDDGFTRFDASLYNCITADLSSSHDRTQMGLHLIVNDEHERAALASLDC